MTLENFKYRTNPLFLRNQFSKQTDVFGIPIIPRPHFSQEELQNLRLLGFDQIKHDEGKHRNRMVHFFLYDYKFERIWEDSEPFVKLLRPYRAVLTPDFSMYTEMPPALQLYNTFRNRWCGAYLAEQGLRVVPTVSWGTEESFNFCFAGIEKGSVIAVSTYMFHAHGNHADQKELFMNGYRELLRRIQPEYVICYSEPFPEMEGNIIYIDYDLSSWKHMEDNIIPVEFVKHTHPVLTRSPIYSKIVKTGYVCKGGGSAYGGEWQPKTEDAKRFKGEPNTIKRTKDKNGELRETVIGQEGRATVERHHSTHNKPHAHSNPHDQIITWEGSDQHPRLGPPINYGPPFNDNPVPDITSYLPGGKAFMEHDVVKQPQHIEYDHFESISDFKWCMHCGGEVEFYYHGIGYSITHPKGIINIGRFCQPDTELESHDSEDILNYLMDDGKKLREVIKEVDVAVRTI